MPTLANINGASLVADTSNPLNLLLKAFGTKQSRDAEAAKVQQQADLQRLIAEAMGGAPIAGAAAGGVPSDDPNAPGVPATTFPLADAPLTDDLPLPGGQVAPAPRAEPDRRAQEIALARIAAINPKVASEVRAVLERGDKRELAAVQQETEKGTRLALHVQGQPDYQSKRRAIMEAGQAAAARGEPVNRFIELSNLPEQELDLALRRMVVQGADLKTLTDQALKPQERFDAVTDERGNIIGQRSSVTGQVVKDPRAVKTEAQFAQEIELARERGRAAGAPVNALAGVMAQERLTRERLEQRELEGKIEEREAKLKRGREAVTARKQAAEAKASIVIGKVDEALNLSKKAFAAGFPGQILSKIGGTPARNLEATVETIKANLSFSELQAMREASPTGGALGGIAVKELDLLGSTISSLEVDQSPEQLRSNLKKVKQHYQNWLGVMKRAPTPKSADDVDSSVINFKDL